MPLTSNSLYHATVCMYKGLGRIFKSCRAQLSPLDLKAWKAQCDCRVAQRCAQQQLPMPDPAWAASLEETESSRRDEFHLLLSWGVSRQQENFS